MTHTYSSDGTMIPMVDLYLPLQHYNDTYCLTNYSVFTPYIVTTTITSLWSILLQHPLRLPALYYYSNYYVFMIYLATETITSFWSTWSQQLLHPMIYIVTTTITSLRSISLQHLLRPHDLLLQQLLPLYDLYYYSNHLIFTNYIVTATLTILWSILSQQLIHPQDL